MVSITELQCQCHGKVGAAESRNKKWQISQNIHGSSSRSLYRLAASERPTKLHAGGRHGHLSGLGSEGQRRHSTEHAAASCRPPHQRKCCERNVTYPSTFNNVRAVGAKAEVWRDVNARSRLGLQVEQFFDTPPIASHVRRGRDTVSAAVGGARSRSPSHS